jgi:hypothetical protein
MPAARSRSSIRALLSKWGMPVDRSALATDARISQGTRASPAAAMMCAPCSISAASPVANGVVTA